MKTQEKSTNFNPIATLIYNDLIYVQVFPAPKDGNGVEMVELRIQNTCGVDFTNNVGADIFKSRFVSVKKLEKGWDCSFFLKLGAQTIVRGTRFRLVMNFTQRLAYDEQLAAVLEGEVVA
jgi:hypothetical protein